MNKCNCCGKEIQEHEAETFKYQYGYLSKRDMDLLNLTLCPDCVDIWTDKLIEECKVNPVIEWTGDSDDPYGDNILVEAMANQILGISLEEYLEAEGF